MARSVLKINDFDVGPYIKEDGIKYSTVTRNEKSFIAMDGTKNLKEIDKMKLSIDILDMSDSQFTDFCECLRPNPAEVELIDFERDVSYTNAPFYVTRPTYTHKKSIGTVTYVCDINFSIEEK